VVLRTKEIKCFSSPNESYVQDGSAAAHLSLHLNSINRSTVEGEWFW
jgi:hypothetical protein